MEEEKEKIKKKKQKKSKKKNRSGQTDSGVFKTEEMQTASAFDNHRCEENNGCNMLADNENSRLPVSKGAADIHVSRIDLSGSMDRFHLEHGKAEGCKLVVESSIVEDLDMHSDSSELSRKAEFELKFRGDINASTDMSRIPSKEDDRTALRYGKGCQVETLCAPSGYTEAHPTSFENEDVINELKEALEKEAANSNKLRTRMSLLEERVAARDNTEASTQCEIEGLRNENVELQKQVEEMKDYVERLLLERQQLTYKILAMQRGMQQHGQEIPILTEDNFTHSWKRNTEDPLENGAAITEESKIQMSTAARMIEKLVAENSELVEKVNEQSGFIDRLTQRYSSLVEAQNFQLEKHYPAINYISDAVKFHDPEHEPMAEQALDAVIPTETVTSEIQRDSPQVERKLVSESLLMESIENGLSVVTHQFTTGTLESSMESTVELTGASLEKGAQVSGMTNENVPIKQKESVPFSDAPLMGAPIRLLSFMARFVSGADLVKTRSPEC